MTIHLAGSELDVLIPLTADCRETTAVPLAFDSARSRCAIALGLSVVFGSGTGLITSAFPATANGWYHWTYYNTFVLGFNNTAGSFVEIRNGAATVVFRLSFVSSGASSQNNVQASYWNGAAYVNTGVVFSFPRISRILFDLNVDFATGFFTLYIGGVAVASGSGWVGTAGFTAVSFAICNGGSSTGPSIAYASEVIVADEDTRGFRVTTVPAVAAGANTAFAGTASDINEIILNDATSISGATNGDQESFTIATPAISNLGVKAVCIGCRGSNNGAVPLQMDGLIRVAGSNYFSATFNPGAALLGRSIVFAINPATGNPFNSTDITAANIEFGFAAIT